MQKNNANVIYVGQTCLLNTCRVFRLPSVALPMPGRILKEFSQRVNRLNLFFLLSMDKLNTQNIFRLGI